MSNRLVLIAKPRPILQGSGRVIRGGGWSRTGQFCRSANRNGDVPTFRRIILGFRIILRKRVS